MCMQIPAIATLSSASRGDASSELPLVDASVLTAFAGQLRYSLTPERATRFLQDESLAAGANGDPVLEVPQFLSLFDGGGKTLRLHEPVPAINGGVAIGLGDTPPARNLPKEQKKRHLQQQKKPSERYRQLVLQQRVSSLTNSERQLVTQLREALFERRSNMKKMFESCDLNDDGVVTLEEFLYALEHAGVAVGHEIDRAKAVVSEEEAARMLSFFDRDGQGVLRYNEFMRLLQGTIELPGAAPPPEERFAGRRINELGDEGRELADTRLIREVIGLGYGDREDISRVQNAFRRWDTNSDGFITERELHAVLQKLDPRFTSRDVHRLMGSADANGDGAIDHQEFVAWLFR